MSNRFNTVTIHLNPGQITLPPSLEQFYKGDRQFDLFGMTIPVDNIKINHDGSQRSGVIRIDYFEDEFSLVDQIEDITCDLVVCCDQQYVICDLGVTGAYGGALGFRRTRGIHLEPFPM